MRLVLLVIGLIATGCGAQAPLAFEVGPLPEGWHAVNTKSDLAFRSAQGGTIYANVECKETDDAPLDVLANHLLFGVDVKHEEREEFTLAGRKALRSQIEGELDGVPIRL